MTRADSTDDLAAAGVLGVDEHDPAPAYVQIERRVRMAVADGTLRPGERLPSVRHLATRLGLATNTVGRAYADLAREGVIVARAGGGSEVAPRDSFDAQELALRREKRLRVLARQVAVRGLALGFQPVEILESVANQLTEHSRAPQETPQPEE